MTQRNTLVSGIVLLICGGLLVLFTDVEISLVRWFNCNAPLTPSEHHTELCR